MPKKNAKNNLSAIKASLRSAKELKENRYILLLYNMSTYYNNNLILYLFTFYLLYCSAIENQHGFQNNSLAKRLLELGRYLTHRVPFFKRFLTPSETKILLKNIIHYAEKLLQILNEENLGSLIKNELIKRSRAYSSPNDSIIHDLKKN